jgi:hypothetical protein
VLGDPAGLGLAGEIVKYAEVGALLGGETAIQGAARNPESDRAITGLLADPAPPFALYPSNLNHVGALGNPLAGLP